MMKYDNMKMTLQTRITEVIDQETEGLLKYELDVRDKTKELVDLVITQLFGNEDENEGGIEELCPDMDLFVEE